MRLFIPSSFRREPFYTTEEVVIDVSSNFAHTMETNLFYYELSETLEPWLERETYLPLIFECWKEQETRLIALFKTRQKALTKQPMIQMIALFIDGLFWMNESPVPSLLNVENYAGDLRLHPVNIEERLSFVLSGPERFHSFVQLQALMTELEKLYARDVVMEKHKKNKR
ncbi:YpoC family protein [Halalkalibacter urbisdiaboli]|uniref:YpoC family protein n=1 Tax=Halalkalibacter urbisdiaboli TaxID=1960589 RepID=UPI000B44F5E7|nr:hypothetical protein [Halalkalibacter urbisdiaboli]